nr:MAG TPA: hypothetical protein [Ackermannviridae sp.]
MDLNNVRMINFLFRLFRKLDFIITCKFLK